MVAMDAESVLRERYGIEVPPYLSEQTGGVGKRTLYHRVCTLSLSLRVPICTIDVGEERPVHLLAMICEEAFVAGDRPVTLRAHDTTRERFTELVAQRPGEVAAARGCEEGTGGALLGNVWMYGRRFMDVMLPGPSQTRPRVWYRVYPPAKDATWELTPSWINAMLPGVNSDECARGMRPSYRNGKLEFDVFAGGDAASHTLCPVGEVVHVLTQNGIHKQTPERLSDGRVRYSLPEADANSFIKQIRSAISASPLQISFPYLHLSAASEGVDWGLSAQVHLFYIV